MLNIGSSRKHLITTFYILTQHKLNLLLIKPLYSLIYRDAYQTCVLYLQLIYHANIKIILRGGYLLEI